MEHRICPYPGLRPFSEEESIFFKGRETHVSKAVSLLEQNRFLMITGASGDGKSSLTYAGLIPRARAGFFKAEYNTWLLADFTPSRRPLQQLAQALSQAMKVPFERVQETLKNGFSALLQLYAESGYYIDPSSDEWNQADDAGKKSLRKKGANLLILADQFEEFFTNPENYSHGQASDEAQLVINLLLETARIAHAQSLPVYVVCTMRSDYIGQCAAFRGLPEMIGFSQFFVPRLKRKELQQVIAEPAKLSGSVIAPRLTETLVNAIGSGFDQLPVLQHALNSLWQLSYGPQGSGKPMDLLSLVMIAGAPADYLDETEKSFFHDWLQKQPDFKKTFFEKPSLENVLNAHAGELYHQTLEQLEHSYANQAWLPQKEKILQTILQCLVKADAGRYVRNRMTVAEITEIVGVENFEAEQVAAFVNLFREQGNTFVRPYTNEQETLTPDSLLDISHESLIRNWSLLQDLSRKEYDDRMVYGDFVVQMQRWNENQKSKGYLLPIGSLTYFESWFKSKKPTPGWLLKYDESVGEKASKRESFARELTEGNTFIQASARQLFFSRMVLKYGANRLLMFAGLLLLTLGCTYYYLDWNRKQNSRVIEAAVKENLENLSDPYIGSRYKAEFLVDYSLYQQEKPNPSIFIQEISSLDDTLRFSILCEALHRCISIGQEDTVSYCNDRGFISALAEQGQKEFETITQQLIKGLKKQRPEEIHCNKQIQWTQLLLALKTLPAPALANIQTWCEKTHQMNESLMLQLLSHKQRNSREVYLEQTKINRLFLSDYLLIPSPKYQSLSAFFDTQGDCKKLQGMCDSLFNASAEQKSANFLQDNGWIIPMIVLYGNDSYRRNPAFQNIFITQNNKIAGEKPNTDLDVAVWGTLFSNPSNDSHQVCADVKEWLKKQPDRIRILFNHLLFSSNQQLLYTGFYRKDYLNLSQYFLSDEVVNMAFQASVKYLDCLKLNADERTFEIAYYQRIYALHLFLRGKKEESVSMNEISWKSYQSIQCKSCMPEKMYRTYEMMFHDVEYSYSPNSGVYYYRINNKMRWTSNALPNMNVKASSFASWKSSEMPKNILSDEKYLLPPFDELNLDYTEKKLADYNYYHLQLSRSLFTSREINKTNVFAWADYVFGKGIKPDKDTLFGPKDSRFIMMLKIPSLCEALIARGYGDMVNQYMDSTVFTHLKNTTLLNLAAAYQKNGFEEYAIKILNSVFKKNKSRLNTLNQQFVFILSRIGGKYCLALSDRIIAVHPPDYFPFYFSKKLAALIDNKQYHAALQSIPSQMNSEYRYQVLNYLLRKDLPEHATFNQGLHASEILVPNPDVVL